MDIIALDIETETRPCHEPAKPCCSQRGLNPEVSFITAASITDREGTEIFKTSVLGEAGLLRSLNSSLNKRSGYLITWNGSAFDLPFIAERAKVSEVKIDLELKEDRLILIKYQPLPGHKSAYRGRWGNLEHVDIQFAYKEIAKDAKISWGLKPVAKHLGLNPIEVDRLSMHALTEEQLDEYVASDTMMTLKLAMMVGDLTNWSDSDKFYGSDR